MENHNYENEGQFQRKMTSRHLFMLSLGGVIGTGLFLSSGYTIAQAGPLGAILSYLVGAVVVYLVMLSLGELAVAMPVTGSFHTYATKFISPGTGFTVAWLYWICWTVALGTEFLGAAMLMQRWFPSVPAWIFAAECIPQRGHLCADGKTASHDGDHPSSLQPLQGTDRPEHADGASSGK